MTRILAFIAGFLCGFYFLAAWIATGDPGDEPALIV